MVPFCESVCDRKNLTYPFSFSDTLLRANIATTKFRSPGLHLELLRDQTWRRVSIFYLFPILIFAHMPPQTFPRLQCYLHLDRVSRLVPCGAVVFAEPRASLSVELQSSRIYTHPEFLALAITGSCAPLHTLCAGSSGYLTSLLSTKSYYRR